MSRHWELQRAALSVCLSFLASQWLSCSIAAHVLATTKMTKATPHLGRPVNSFFIPPSRRQVKNGDLVTVDGRVTWLRVV
jgi:hypothetical protein